VYEHLVCTHSFVSPKILFFVYPSPRLKFRYGHRPMLSYTDASWPAPVRIVTTHCKMLKIVWCTGDSQFCKSTKLYGVSFICDHSNNSCLHVLVQERLVFTGFLHLGRQVSQYRPQLLQNSVDYKTIYIQIQKQTGWEFE